MIRLHRIRQKIIGIMFIICCAMIIYIAVSSTQQVMKDVTPVVLLLPFGLYLLFTKEDLSDYEYGGNDEYENDKNYTGK